MNTDKNTMQQKFHPISVSGTTDDNHLLGQEIAKMRYDKIVEVIRGMESEFERQAQYDQKQGRIQLVSLSADLQQKIQNLSGVVEKMLLISRPYMEHEFRDEK